MTGERMTRLAHHLTRFLIGTLLGLVVDFGIYSVAVALGLEPGWANLVSSTVAIVVMYFVNTRYTFRVRPTLLSFVVFVAWYAASVTGFSVLVQLIHDTWHLAPLWSKVALLPLSFVTNFVATRFILLRGVERRPVPEDQQ